MLYTRKRYGANRVTVLIDFLVNHFQSNFESR